MTELLHLLTDPAHWAFEVITDLMLGAVGAVAVRPLLRRHDRKHHDIKPAARVDDVYRADSFYGPWKEYDPFPEERGGRW